MYIRALAFIVVVTLLAPLTSSVRAADDPEAAYYRVEEVKIPDDAYLEVGGLAFTPDGTLYVCTRRGEIWALKGGQWRRFATGLHEALGLLALGNGDLLVAHRPELTRVRDSNRDGAADRFETVANGWGLSGNYHEYHYGPVRDGAGNLYGTLNLGWDGRGVAGAKYRGYAYKVTPQGRFIPYANGLRSPAGIGISPTGDIFVTDNQGDWMATSPLFHLTEGAFFGHPASLKWETGYSGPADPEVELPTEKFVQRRKLPAVWFPYGAAGQSPSEPIWDTTAGKFGPFRGQMFVGDQTRSFVMRVALERVGGEFQGAVIPFRRGFGSGITRMAFGPDHALWVGGTDRGWGATGGKPYALQRLVWTGVLPTEIATVKATSRGFELTFTKPVDREAAARPASYALRHHRYEYWKTYGSPARDLTTVEVSRAEVSADGKRVSLTLPTMVKERVYELKLTGVQGQDGTPLLHPLAFYTLNRIP